jgi:HPr kinase/phosphorylase
LLLFFKKEGLSHLTLLHASCAARGPAGVLLIGPPGAGKSDLLLRLIDRGFVLVADDQVQVDALTAAPPPALAGLLEVRGLGILRLPHQQACKLALVVLLQKPPRLPVPARHEVLDLPMISVDPFTAAAPIMVGLALDALQGKMSFVTGAFA